MSALSCKQIVKSFGTATALSDANLNVSAGTIHALVGENGAGKSTLINIVSGLLKPNQGRIRVFDEDVAFNSPLDANARGIGMVHQHFLLADALTVAENVALGLRNSAFGWRFDRIRAETELAKLAAETGLHVDPAARIADLPVGLRQRVEILKALSRGAKILLLDEPTAVLAPPEVETLFETLRALRLAGRTIVIVTHKLDEVFALAADVTVLRAGRTVFAGPLQGMTPQGLAEKMIGRELPHLPVSPPHADAATQNVLELRNIDVPGALRIEQLQLRGGEIVGVAGVEGNGQAELAAVIAGTLSLADSGPAQMQLGGKSILHSSIRDRSEAGVAFIPADRHREGLILELSLSDNLFLRTPLTRDVLGVSALDHAAMAKTSDSRLREYGVNAPRPELPAHALSGGNQQKVIVARELSRGPRLILACNPTRGLDIGAANDVHARLLAAAREHRAAVLLISSDLDEVLALSDRVTVLYKGKLAEVGVRGVEKAAVGRAMVGAA
jgi:ABC-type uncharacterized transport system ATPase subunit